MAVLNKSLEFKWKRKFGRKQRVSTLALRFLGDNGLACTSAAGKLGYSFFMAMQRKKK